MGGSTVVSPLGPEPCTFRSRILAIITLKSSLRARQPPPRSPKRPELRERQRTRTRSLGKARRLAPCMPTYPKPESFCQRTLVTRVAPPNPSRFGAAQMDKDWTHQPFTIWGRHANGQGLDPPQPFTIWSGSCKRTRVAPPPNSSRFGVAQNGQGLDPPNPSRFGAAPTWTRIGPPNPSRFGAATQLDKDGKPPL